MYKDLLEALEASVGRSGFKRDVSIESDRFTAFVFRGEGGYGVGIPYDGRIEINEKFNNIVFRTWNVGGINCLCLWTDAENLLTSFAGMAWDFILPGRDNSNRLDLLSDPYTWFEKWKKLVGNYAKDLLVYDVIGELKTFLILAEEGKKPVWTSETLSCHDIEAADGTYEVKTTLSHSGSSVHISSLEQMQPEGESPLTLVLVRAQESKNGETIKSLRDEVVSKGYIGANEIDQYLLKKGYSPLKLEYKKGYQVYRISSYLVDSDFPRIVLTDFVGGRLPLGVESISYTINLPAEKENVLFPKK